MKKPVLVIMAAGMGSRYGGLKQIDPVDKHGNLIIDFSIYDAIRAGFEKIVCIIKHEIEDDFNDVIGNRIKKYIKIEYAYQDLNNLPAGFACPEGRTKPWGTAQAILSCKDLVDGPFAVINADDYYGRDAFQAIYDYLQAASDDEKYRYSMVGYVLGNTLTDHGHVARGVCDIDADGNLADIHERTHIEKKDGGAAYTEDDGKTWVSVPLDSTVSMNLWGFTPSILQEIDNRFSAFLKSDLEKNPLKCEYFLPSVVSQLLEEDKATVKVLHSGDKWYGVTYRQDKEVVEKAIEDMKAKGVYPEKLWEE